MILIQDIILSDDIIKKQFVCDLSHCKGDCCQEGDFGAPLTKKEEVIMKGIYDKVTPYMSVDCLHQVQTKGMFTHFVDKEENIDFIGTSLMDDGRCVFMGRNKDGSSFCAIEKAYLDKKIDWQKPVSCHLYPIRIAKDSHTGMTLVNYNVWSLCSSACELGKKEGVAIYEFTKDALIRRFGEDFYIELDALAKHYR